MFIRGRNKFAAQSYERDASFRQFRKARRNDSLMIGTVYVIIFPAILIVILAVASIIPNLIPESVAYNAAEVIGFTHVHVIKREWLFIQFTGCDKNDSVKFTVTGTNSAGKHQTFIVCAGLFKGGTPRFQ